MSPWLFDFAYRGCVLGRQGGLSVWHGVKRDVTADSTLNHIIFLQVKKSERVVQTDGERQTLSLRYSGIFLFSTTASHFIAGVYFTVLSQPKQRCDWLLYICRDIKESKEKWDFFADQEESVDHLCHVEIVQIETVSCHCWGGTRCRKGPELFSGIDALSLIQSVFQFFCLILI